MVEMRWKPIDDQFGARLPNEVHVGPYVPGRYVLQYREGSVVEHDYYGRIESWSEWQDVPVVREGEG